jgi:ABC-2 type transport system permease protein
VSELVAPAAILPTAARRLPALSDALTMSGRCLRTSRRQLDALLTMLMLPILLMLLFVYLFGGAIQTGTQYVTYVVPGILVFCAGFGSSTTAVTVAQDMRGGIVDRFRSMDIGGPAVIAGHVVANVVRNAVSTVLVLGVGYLVGFRPHATALGWLGAAGMLLLFVLTFSWLSAAAGLLAGSAEAANGFGFFLMFLPYPSSTFVPVATMPGWIHGFANNQPITPVIETLRGLLLNQPIGSHAWLAVAWCAGILVASVTLCAVLFQRRTA